MPFPIISLNHRLHHFEKHDFPSPGTIQNVSLSSSASHVKEILITTIMMGGVTGGNKGTMQDFPSLLLLFGCHLVVGEDDHHDDEGDHDDDDEDDHDDDDEDDHNDDPNLSII